ncbi:unnamed protein product [Discula destructiva]
MAPAATADYPSSGGAALDALSDNIDAVNVLKDQARQTLADSLAADEADAFDAAAQFDATKDKSTFRQYEDACDRVKNFYAEQHAKQTVAYNLAARTRFNSAARPRVELTIWEAMEKLETLVDESDPDTELGQIAHLLQSAEAIRRDGKPRWMQLTGLIHDLGKLMYFYDEAAEGQWAVVGDTFPVGCRFDERIVLSQGTFEKNPDWNHPVYSTEFGIYERGCGLDNVMLSWGHDEYLYHVVKDQSRLPDEALAMIRYHSFYPWHKEGAYRELMCEKDHAMLKAAKAFNPYDLYSKSDGIPSVEELKPYYLELIDEYFPQKTVKW